MIDRYSCEPMKQVWTPKNKFQKWLDVEIAACKAHAEMGTIPWEDVNIIIEKAAFEVERIDEIEAEVQHDVIAFLTNVAEHVGPSSRFVHLGLTSSDVVDTAFSLLIEDAGRILLNSIDEFMEELKVKALTYKFTPIMGRTHGVHAEPTTWGLKLTVVYEEMKRNRTRLLDAIVQIKVGKLSGAVGNYAHMSPAVEARVCQILGLAPSNASTQILQRDRHAHFITTLAIIAGTLDKLATEIRALQKTEVNEILEPFSDKQKGSSAMPHKKNPILCERVSGLSRTIRGYAVVALENQNLWHERDISHSSSERIIFPDACINLDYMLHIMKKVLKGMTVNVEQMKLNISRSNNVFYSQQLLLKLIDKGMLREDAYRVVQKNAHQAFQEGVLFDDKIRQDAQITDVLSEEEIQSIFSLEKYLTYVDYIFERVYQLVQTP
jgi:adenylosuccinate lyase